ncbi:uncharacterized protein F4817DRAFT_72230 [Daldinia loculata]|uniref:uncharacterized protein n=1 Tax=Daldinia loculata TaxID=103429 RepID=UPI0020C41D74|nr:uncharacterized protein F4817DRAFT_72230 [Daldinia loculata]KAI1648367.1 hypothetical protein F4817DRAFT_72230 [Daldinia loculata]
MSSGMLNLFPSPPIRFCLFLALIFFITKVSVTTIVRPLSLDIERYIILALVHYMLSDIAIGHIINRLT